MTPLERQLDRIERRMLHRYGIVAGAAEPHELIKAMTAASWDEALHPRGRDGKFIEKFGFVKGIFNWVKDAGDGTNPMSKGTSKKADRVKIVGFSSGQGGSTNNPWVKVEYDGPDPDLKGKVGFARANEVEEAAAQKARIDAPDVPDAPSAPRSPKGAKANPFVPDTDGPFTEAELGDGSVVQVGSRISGAAEVTDAAGRVEFVDLEDAEIKGIEAPYFGMDPDSALLVVEVDSPFYRGQKAQAHISASDASSSGGAPDADTSETPDAPTPTPDAPEWTDEERDTILALRDRVHQIEQANEGGDSSAFQKYRQQVDADMRNQNDDFGRNAASQLTDSELDEVIDEMRALVDAGEMGLSNKTDLQVLEQERQSRVGDAEIELDTPSIPDEAPAGPDPRGDADQVRQFLEEEIVTKGLSPDDASVRGGQLDALYTQIGFGSALDTDSLHNKLGESGDIWTEERQALHQEMWDELYSQIQAAGIPQERDALALGGLPGAGKSFTLKPGEAASEFGVVSWEPEPGSTAPDGATHVSINPDIIKEMLIEKGALPEGMPEALKPLEQVNFIHEESSYLSKLFVKMLSDEGYNLVLDNTMETPTGMLKRMRPLAGEGYSFRGLFVDIPVSESRESARKRYERGLGTKLGGRFVPSGVQRDTPSPNGRLSPNRDAFDELAGIDPDGNVTGTGWFTDFMVVDNTGVSGNPPKPKKEVTLRGTGDGSPAALYDTRNDQMEEIEPTVAAAGDPQITDDQFSKRLRLGEISPEEGLEMLKANEVLVYPTPDEGVERASASWGEIEDIGAGSSSIQHALFQAGGRELAEAYSTEIARLRSDGHVLTF